MTKQEEQIKKNMSVLYRSTEKIDKAVVRINENFSKGLISDELYEKAFQQLDEAIQKARVTKYFKKEGTKGNYKYYYTEADYNKAKSKSGVKESNSEKKESSKKEASKESKNQNKKESVIQANEKRFKERFAEFNKHNSPTNGSKDHSEKFKRMTKDLLGDNHIIGGMYTNGDSIIKFYAYDKKNNTISFFKMSESNNSSKVKVIAQKYKVNDNPDSNMIGELIENKSSNFFDRTSPDGDYRAYVGFNNPKSMTDSEIQEFYNALNELGVSSSK